MRRFILTFHGIGTAPAGTDADERKFWIEPGLYTAILDDVRGRDEVAITFDDGNRSDVTVALPAVLERGMRAEFFVVGDRIGAPGYLDPGDLRELAAAGMGVGTHGGAHRRWRGLDDDALRADVAHGRAAVEGVLGAPARRASCPFGAYDRRVLGELRRAGFERVYTSDRGWTRDGSWIQARNSVTADWGRLRAQIEGREPLRARAVRPAKRLTKRWR